MCNSFPLGILSVLYNFKSVPVFHRYVDENNIIYIYIYVCVCVCVCVCIHECIQAYLGDILSSASDHHNENKFEVMPSHTNFVFPAHIKVMFLLYCCVLSVK